MFETLVENKIDLQEIPAEEIVVLKELAERLAELAHDPKNKERAGNWTRLNDLDTSVKPQVLVHLWEIAWSEILPKKETFKCSSPDGFFYENQMRRKIWMAENIDDDGVLEPLIKYPTSLDYKPYGELNWEVQYADDDPEHLGAGHYNPVLLEKNDIDKLNDPFIFFDKEYMEASRQQAEAIFGGILDVIPHTTTFSPKVVDEYSWLRGLDKIYFDLMDEPEWVHAVLSRICDNQIKRMKGVDALGLWGQWDKSDPLGSAGLRHSSEMANYKETMKKGKLGIEESWGFFTAEAFNNISPEMHDEFAYTYDRKMAPLFKFLNVGCCEVLHDKIQYLKDIPNVRKIAVSEWAQIEKAGKEIGDKYVYCYKPSGVPFVMDWTEGKEKARDEIAKVLQASKGCPVELVLNIGGTTGKNGRETLKEWTDITNEEVRKVYG